MKIIINQFNDMFLLNNIMRITPNEEPIEDNAYEITIDGIESTAFMLERYKSKELRDKEFERLIHWLAKSETVLSTEENIFRFTKE